MTSSVRTIIVDDEPLARERLRRLLTGRPEIDIVAECGDGDSAGEAIASLAPDLVFLDVQMPGRDGLQVLAEVPADRRPAIVFVTAHPHFALDAFDYGAVDYLLKPFDRERFQLALERVAAFLRSRGRPPLSGASEKVRPPDRLAIRTDGKVIFVRPEEIHWVEAADNYVILHLAGRQVMTRETLKAMEEQLRGANFARIHRSAFVQVEQVAELHPAAHGDYVVVLRDGTRLPLSRSLRGQWSRLVGTTDL